jgi:hypothetical protein
MKMKCTYISIFVFSFLALQGCYRPPTVSIFAGKFPMRNIDIIKNAILNESYSRYDYVDDVPHCADYGSFKDCYYLTRYIKQLVSLSPQKSSMYIGLSFKKFDYPSDYYRNLAVSISPNTDNNDNLMAEFTKMKDLMYKIVSENGGENLEIRK